MRERQAETQLLESLRWLPAGSAVCAIHQKADQPVARVGSMNDSAFGCRSCVHYVMRIESAMAEGLGGDGTLHLPNWTAAPAQPEVPRSPLPPRRGIGW
jgi:hypothetical protein